MNLDNVVHSLKESLLFSDGKSNNPNTSMPSASLATPHLFLLVGWFLICQYFKVLTIYILPLAPLLYYCFRPKKADHLALAEWWRDQCVQQVNGWTQQYSRRGHPPHLFLGGLYVYIVWVTLHQTLPTRWIVFALGAAWIIRDHWPVLSFTDRLVKFLFPSTDPTQRRPTMVQRALTYQQKAMITLAQEPPLTFVIYENQRRSPLTGTWHALTLPLERTAWTDDAHATVLAKHEYVLPSPVQLDQQGHKVVWTWVWVDSDWQSSAWEYGNFVWQPNNNKKEELEQGYTRRRPWTRRAILESTRVLYQERQQEQRQQQQQHEQQHHQQKQQQQHSPLVIDPPPYTTSTRAMVSPLSPQPSLSSKASLYDHHRPVEFSSSQASLLSTKTDDPAYRPDPKRSSSRSTRRQAVWKSIVKT